jgi:hypothetical protein
LQRIYPSVGIGQTILLPGDLFGYSVDISGNTLVGGAPERDEAQIYLGREPVEANSSDTYDTGAIFVFERVDEYNLFSYLQNVPASNIKVRALNFVCWK